MGLQSAMAAVDEAARLAGEAEAAAESLMVAARLASQTLATAAVEDREHVLQLAERAETESVKHLTQSRQTREHIRILMAALQAAQPNYSAELNTITEVLTEEQQIQDEEDFVVFASSAGDIVDIDAEDNQESLDNTLEINPNTSENSIVDVDDDDTEEETRSHKGTPFRPVESLDVMRCGGVEQRVQTRLQCITAMEEYSQLSLEELRYEDCQLVSTSSDTPFPLAEIGHTASSPAVTCLAETLDATSLSPTRKTVSFSIRSTSKVVKNEQGAPRISADFAKKTKIQEQFQEQAISARPPLLCLNCRSSWEVCRHRHGVTAPDDVHPGMRVFTLELERDPASGRDAVVTKFATVLGAKNSNIRIQWESDGRNQCFGFTRNRDAVMKLRQSIPNTTPYRFSFACRTEEIAKHG